MRIEPECFRFVCGRKDECHVAIVNCNVRNKKFSFMRIVYIRPVECPITI